MKDGLDFAGVIFCPMDWPHDSLLPLRESLHGELSKFITVTHFHDQYSLVPRHTVKRKDGERGRLVHRNKTHGAERTRAGNVVIICSCLFCSMQYKTCNL